MPEVIVRYKTEKTLQALRDFAKYFDIIIEPLNTKKSEKQNPPTTDLPVRVAKKPDANALSGIWKDHPLTIEDLRNKAWGERI